MTTPLDFEALVARHQGAVCAIAYAVLRDRARSEEVAQEAFLVAWQKLPGMVPAPSLPGWVCGIARNLARNAARRRRPEKAMSEEPAVTESPLDHVLAQERSVLADRALASLPEKEREAIVLYFRGDESLASVAAALGISEAAAKKRVLRGRVHLRDAGREVEATLARTRPTAAFTAGCVAALAAGGAAKASAGTMPRSVGTKLAIGGVIAAIATTTAVWATRRDPARLEGAASVPTPVAVAATNAQAIDPAARHALAARIAEARALRLSTAHATPTTRAPVANPTSAGDAPGLEHVRTYDFAGSALVDPIPSAAATPVTTAPPPGMISKRELREAIRLVQPLVRDCYDRDGHGAHGTLALVVRLEGEPGTGMIATDARVDGEFAKNGELAECVKQSLLSIEMPPLDVGGIYDVNYPFSI